MRPGRIDRIIYVGLPDENARKHIFEIHLSKIPTDESINIDKLVEKVSLKKFFFNENEYLCINRQYLILVLKLLLFAKKLQCLH